MDRCPSLTCPSYYVTTSFNVLNRLQHLLIVNVMHVWLGQMSSLDGQWAMRVVTWDIQQCPLYTGVYYRNVQVSPVCLIVLPPKTQLTC